MHNKIYFIAVTGESGPSLPPAMSTIIPTDNNFVKLIFALVCAYVYAIL